MPTIWDPVAVGEIGHDDVRIGSRRREGRVARTVRPGLSSNTSPFRGLSRPLRPRFLPPGRHHSPVVAPPRPLQSPAAHWRTRPREGSGGEVVSICGAEGVSGDGWGWAGGEVWWGRIGGMRVLIAPDKFAGTLTAVEAAAAIEEGWRRRDPDAEVLVAPMADGGPGFIDVLSAVVDGSLLSVTVRGPLGDEVPATVLVAGETAYIETAQACGSASGRVGAASAGGCEHVRRRAVDRCSG